jgi:hypothetical protein
LDPSLLGNKEFLASYPAVEMFIAQHPEISRNSTYFLGQPRYSQQYVNDPARLASEIMTPLAVMLVLGSAIAAIAWIVKSIIDYRRWLRMSKVQTEVHSKLLDRFTASNDLLAYIQTSRILFSVQVGIIIGFAGLGVLYASRTIESEIAQPFFVLGVLGIALSIGFILSALAAYAISRSLGLIHTTEAGQSGSPPA